MDPIVVYFLRSLVYFSKLNFKVINTNYKKKKMPQELQVLQCAKCETFQVDIVKKIPKWTCKMCNEKQSVVKVFGKGSGKECREHVQSLNEKRLKMEQLKTDQIFNNCETEENFSNEEINQSKWLKYTNEN